MNTKRARFVAIAAAIMIGTAHVPASAGVPQLVYPAAPEVVTAVKGNCYAIGQAVAADYGGKLAAAREQKSGGRNVCVLVILVPGKNGQRPRRQEVVVPL